MNETPSALWSSPPSEWVPFPFNGRKIRQHDATQTRLTRLDFKNQNRSHSEAMSSYDTPYRLQTSDTAGERAHQGGTTDAGAGAGAGAGIAPVNPKRLPSFNCWSCGGSRPRQQQQPPQQQPQQPQQPPPPPQQDAAGATIPSSFCIIDDFHPLNFKKMLNQQDHDSQINSTSVQSSGPGFKFTGPIVLSKNNKNMNKKQHNEDDDGSVSSSDGSIGWYMTPKERQRLKNDSQLSDADKRIVQYLAMRKFHIPGNGYWEDYFYWYE
jgi:hypothetical protein